MATTRRKFRGAILYMTMLVIVGAGALFSIVSRRIDSGIARSEAQERRVQALWLGVSAVKTRSAASRDVRLGNDLARVTVNAFGGGRFTADVVVTGHGAARVDATFGADGRMRSVKEEWRSNKAR